jgi:uncharacterized protein YdaT
MPWTPDEFKAKFFKKAKGGQAKGASKQANAMMRGGADEGVSIATAIKRSKVAKKLNERKKK